MQSKTDYFVFAFPVFDVLPIDLIRLIEYLEVYWFPYEPQTHKSSNLLEMC